MRAERLRRPVQEGVANPVRSIFRQHAYLRDMSCVPSDARAENHTHNHSQRAVVGDERGLRIELSTPGKAHDVVQKSQGAVESSVLVIDLRIDVVAIASRDGYSCGLVILFRPRTYLNFGVERSWRLHVSPQIRHHE